MIKRGTTWITWPLFLSVSINCGGFFCRGFKKNLDNLVSCPFFHNPFWKCHENSPLRNARAMTFAIKTWPTLSPIIMEVENQPNWKETRVGGAHFPLNHDCGRKSKMMSACCFCSTNGILVVVWYSREFTLSDNPFHKGNPGNPKPELLQGQVDEPAEAPQEGIVGRLVLTDWPSSGEYWSTPFWVENPRVHQVEMNGKPEKNPPTWVFPKIVVPPNHPF